MPKRVVGVSNDADSVFIVHERYVIFVELNLS